MTVRAAGEERIRGAGRRRPRLFPTPGALAIALFVCVVAPITLVALEIDANPRFSPVDEVAHFDYVDRVASGEVPRQGQRLLKSTLREVACRKVALEGVNTPPCATRELEYEQFSATYQYEAQQPPTYYALTVPVRWVMKDILGLAKLDATRAASVVWLVVGLLLTWAAGRIMGIAPLALGGALLLLAAAPVVVYGAGTVSNDATAIPAAGVVALAGALAYRRRGSRVPIMMFGAGFLAAAGKTTNLFPVVAVSALFAVAAIASRTSAMRWETTVRRWLRDGGALLLGGAAATGIWVIVHRSLSLIDLAEEPSFDVLRGGAESTWVGLLRGATELLRPLTGGISGFVPLSPDTLDRHVQAPFYTLLSFLLIGAALAGLFVTPRRWAHVLGLISVPVLYLGGVVFGAGLMITYDVDDPGLTGRYGLSLAPLLILVLAASLAGKWSQRAIAAFAAAFFLTMLGVFVT